MRPWQSLSRRGGSARAAGQVRPAKPGGREVANRGGRGRGPGKDQARLSPGGFVCANASLKPEILRVSGSFGLAAAPDLGFDRVLRRLGSFGFCRRRCCDRPRLNPRWEFYGGIILAVPGTEVYE